MTVKHLIALRISLIVVYVILCDLQYHDVRQSLKEFCTM